MGAVVDEEAVASLGNLDDKLAGMKLSFAGLKMSLAAAFTGETDPKELTNKIIGMIGRMSDDIKNNGPQMLEAGLTLLTTLAQGMIDALPTIRPKLAEMATSIGTWIGDHLPEAP